MEPLPASIFAVYKPKGITSHDVVARVRRVTGVKRVGHAGTLDPLASGVLVIAVGREATKQLSAVVVAEKEYLATIKLGTTSTTDDEEGEKQSRPVDQQPTSPALVAALQQLTGIISQRPPAFSALKISGQPAYRLARRGKPVALKPRLVEVKTIELLRYEWPLVELRLVTGSGFYVRALARDLGERLGVGGYLTALERTRVGQFLKQDAVLLAEFK